MSTLLWIISIYLFTVVFSFPILKRAIFSVKDRFPFINPMFLTTIVAFIPIVNLYYALNILIGERKEIRSARQAIKLLQKIVDETENTELKQELTEIIAELESMIKEDKSK